MNKTFFGVVAGVGLITASTAQAVSMPSLSSVRAPQRSVVANPEVANANDSSDLFGRSVLTSFLAVVAAITIITIVIVVVDKNGASS